MKINRSDLHPLISQRIREKEDRLGRRFWKIWDFTNPMGERYLFGKCKGLTVTLAYYETAVGQWMPVY